MDPTFQVSILRLAKEDVDSIFLWLHQRSPAGANRWYAAFLESASSLAVDPLRHGLAPEASVVTEAVRHCFFKTRAGRNYRILFVVKEFEVRVLRVRGPGQATVEQKDLDR
jgi:plasmid stabilization system protein ParE